MAQNDEKKAEKQAILDEKVLSAVLELRDSGQKVTGEAVFEMVGGGKNACHVAFKRVVAALDATSEPSVAAMAAFRRVWLEAVVAGRELDAAAEDELEAARAEVERLTAEAEQTASAAASAAEAERQVRAELEATNAKLLAELEELRRERDQLAVSGAAQAAEIEALREKLTAAAVATARAEGELNAFKSMQAK